MIGLFVPELMVVSRVRNPSADRVTRCADRLPLPFIVNTPVESVSVWSSCTPLIACCVRASTTWPVSVHVSACGAGVLFPGAVGAAGCEPLQAAELRATTRISHLMPESSPGKKSASPQTSVSP